MPDIIAIVIATLSVFGFYCVLAEIRDFLRHRSKKKEQLYEKIPRSL